MEKKNTYKGLTKKSREYLNNGENNYVEYKQNVDGLKTDDLVAFANSKYGGTIILGVSETKNKNVQQKGNIVGISIGDDTKQKIMNKVNNCTPLVEIQLCYENINDKPIIRLEIPSGNQKPYCTQKGTYLIRGNARNNPLKPNELLEIFLENEYETFLNRFRELEKDINKNIDNFSSNLGNKITEVNSNLERINDVANVAAEYSDEGFALSESVLDGVENQKQQLEDINIRISLIEENILEIMNKYNIEEPKMKRLKDIITNYYEDKINKNISKEEVIEGAKRITHNVDKELLEKWYDQYMENKK